VSESSYRLLNAPKISLRFGKKAVLRSVPLLLLWKSRLRQNEKDLLKTKSQKHLKRVLLKKVQLKRKKTLHQQEKRKKQRNAKKKRKRIVNQKEKRKK